jgi:hypothetical protein
MVICWRRESTAIRVIGGELDKPRPRTDRYRSLPTLCQLQTCSALFPPADVPLCGICGNPSPQFGTPPWLEETRDGATYERRGDERSFSFADSEMITPEQRCWPADLASIQQVLP